MEFGIAALLILITFGVIKKSRGINSAKMTTKNNGKQVLNRRVEQQDEDELITVILPTINHDK